MSVTEREIRLRIVATDTHCGDGEKQRCPHGIVGGDCRKFKGRRDYQVAAWEYFRLDECIAAEGAGQKGGTC